MEAADEFVDEFVLSLDAIIRVGGEISKEDCNNFERIEAALESARDKYGVHFGDEEACVIRNSSNDYLGSSMPIMFQGTFEKHEKYSLNHFIARHAPDLHFCLVSGCTEPQIKTHENKFSNGQGHVRRNLPELVPFSQWTQSMLAKREAIWKELKSFLNKRKADAGGSTASSTQKKQLTLSFSPPTVSMPQRKSSLSDITLVLVKFICLGLFAMGVTKNPGFVYLIHELTSNLKLPAPNTIQRRLLKEFELLIKVRRDLFSAEKCNDVPAQDSDVDLDPYIYHRIFSLQYDCWSNRASEAFLGLTVFFIDRNWELQSVSLGCVPFGGSHTASNTLALITEVAIICNMHNLKILIEVYII